MTALTPLSLEPLRPIALAGVAAPNTRRSLSTGITAFLRWYEPRRADLGPPTKAVVGAYSEWLQSRGLAAATVASRLSAVRRLFLEAADAGYCDPHTASAISRVRGPKRLGQRVGRWLTLDGARELLAAPLAGIEYVTPFERLKRLRDRALLAVLVGCGLRRTECSSLEWDMFQQRDGRWCIVDLRGKGGRIRTVPVPETVWKALEEWRNGRDGYRIGDCDRRGRHGDGGFRLGDVGRDSGGQTEGSPSPTLRGNGTGARGSRNADESATVFPALEYRRIQPRAISPQGVAGVVEYWSRAIGTRVAAHDCRRTCARLCDEGDAPLEQIQFLLGHASVQTTERYLGRKQDLRNSANDRIGL